ncbi:MAG: hypothetical protein ABI758_04970 [Candidatus Woesebacteria bacterium]
MPREFGPIIASESKSLPVGDADSATDDPLGNPRERGEHGGAFAKAGGKFGRQRRRQAVFPGHLQHRRGKVESDVIQPPQPLKVEEKPVERDQLAEKLQQELRRVLLSVPSKNKDFVPYAVEALARALRGNSETFLIQAVLKGQLRIPNADNAEKLLTEIRIVIQESVLLQNHLICGRINKSFAAISSMTVTIKKEYTGQ